MRTHAQAWKTASGLQKAPLTAGSLPGHLTTQARVHQILREPRVQAKLMAGLPSDLHEQEAEQIADADMRIPEPEGRVQADPPRAAASSKAGTEKSVDSSSNIVGLEGSEQGVPTSKSNKLRIADVQYDPQGQPLAEELTPADKARLGALVEEFKRDDPKFYAEIENEDLVVTRGKLPDRTIGLSKPPVVLKKSLPRSAVFWFLVDHSGADLSQGNPDSNSDAWKKAIDLLEELKSEQKEELNAMPKVVRVISWSTSVLILDLDQIDKGKKAYQKAKEEYDKHNSMSRFDTPQIGAPELPQSALATLRHEAGHILFEKIIAYDKNGNRLPSKALPEQLKSEVEKNSLDESIETDIGLLSEYAAENVESNSGPFDLALFKEENDPRFGIGGYYDLEGNAQTPIGFGVRMAEGLTLIGAKQTARDLLRTMVEVPVFLLTVPKAKAEQRRFDVLMLMAAEKINVRDKFDQLKKDFPALGKYKSSVVAF